MIGTLKDPGHLTDLIKIVASQCRMFQWKGDGFDCVLWIVSLHGMWAAAGEDISELTHIARMLTKMPTPKAATFIEILMP